MAGERDLGESGGVEGTLCFLGRPLALGCLGCPLALGCPCLLLGGFRLVGGEDEAGEVDREEVDDGEGEAGGHTVSLCGSGTNGRILL